MDAGFVIILIVIIAVAALSADSCSGAAGNRLRRWGRKPSPAW